MMTEPEQPPRSPAHRVVWKVSGRDFKAHAFLEIGPVFSEALCKHTVPSHQLVERRRETPCVTCALMHGDMLADEHGDPGGFARG